VDSNFGLNQTARIEEPLRQRFVRAFASRVSEPLDAKLDPKLGGRESPLYVGALIQRIALLTRCRGEGCPQAEGPPRPEYRVILSAEDPGIKDGDPRIEQLARTYEAFVRWQPDGRSLEEMQAKEVRRVMQWLNAGGLRSDWILASARTQFPPVRSRDFWRLDAPAQVDPAFTRRAWSEGIQPLISGLRQMAPDVKEVAEPLTRFEAEYRREGIRQWEQFLLGFPQGERVLAGRGMDREAASRVLGPESPYWRALEATHANLASFLDPAAKAVDLPSWLITLQRFQAVKGKLPEAQKKPDPGDPEREAAGLLAAYLAALEQLHSELGTPEKAFRAAQKTFEEGEPGRGAAAGFTRAIWHRDALRQAIGARSGEDRLFWVLFSRPAEFGWTALLGQAGIHVAQQWEALRLELSDLPPGQKAGKILQFVNTSLAPFLERRRDGYATRSIGGDSLPVTRAFLEYLSRARPGSADELGRVEAPRQIVAPF
jgi:hypothetical protein